MPLHSRGGRALWLVHRLLAIRPRVVGIDPVQHVRLAHEVPGPAVSVHQAMRAILDAASGQAPPPSTQLVLERLDILQSMIEMKLDAAFPSRSESVEARSPLPLSFLQNWQLIALIAIITSVETTCLAYCSFISF